MNYKVSQISWPTDSTNKQAGLQLTSSQLEDLPDQHETRLSKRVLFPIHLFSIVWQVTVLFHFFLGTERQHGMNHSMGWTLLPAWIYVLPCHQEEAQPALLGKGLRAIDSATGRTWQRGTSLRSFKGDCASHQTRALRTLCCWSYHHWQIFCLQPCSSKHLKAGWICPDLQSLLPVCPANAG